MTDRQEMEALADCPFCGGKAYAGPTLEDDYRFSERERCAGPDLLAVMEKECWTLRCVDIPTGGGDADVAWDVVSHHMAKPHDRVIATGNTPIKALAAAIRAGGEK